MSPEGGLRDAALTLFDVGVARADPVAATRAALDAHADALSRAHRVVLLGLGKAGSAMTRAALPFVEGKLARGVVVTTDSGIASLPGIDMIAGGHPVPDAGSLEGGARLVDASRHADKGDLVLVLVSGGGSALAVAPPEGVTLDDKIALSDLLLKSGADITQVNTVRGNVSRLKAGGIARLAAPAEVLSLILSDVPGDDVAIIASGPTATDVPGPAEARAVLDSLGLGERVPASIRAHLESAGPRERAVARNVIVGSNALSVGAVEDALKDSGRVVIRLPGWLGGDVSEAAGALFAEIRKADATGRPTAIIAGGETTVRVTGAGSGGRNQELALRIALLADGVPLEHPWCFLSGGTDGRDGPTEAAGGIVDGGSLARMRAAGIDPARRLADNDANPALAASGDLINIGQTGTNVADIQVALIG